MTNYAIHNYHADPIEYDNGMGTVNGVNWYPVPEPIHIAESKEAAEAWRKENSNVG